MDERHCVICKKAFGTTWLHLWEHFEEKDNNCYQSIEFTLSADPDFWVNVKTFPDSYVEYYVYEFATPQIILNYRGQRTKTTV